MSEARAVSPWKIAPEGCRFCHHANYANTYVGKVITGESDITLTKHPKGMVQFTIAPQGNGVIELTRTNLMERLGK